MEVKREMNRNEKEYLKKNAASVRATIFKEPRAVEWWVKLSINVSQSSSKVDQGSGKIHFFLN